MSADKSDKGSGLSWAGPEKLDSSAAELPFEVMADAKDLVEPLAELTQFVNFKGV